ncbi:hypothetical protein [Thiofaba sp. EF100]|jgi:hypothetical protein|uniref:hypothetical protein n=1 Tax=Thiofaba sp. EF100 TaxID=3121274 RepID=UPI003221860F
MDSNTMQKLARFKIMARRLGGFNVDIFRMAQEPSHAREMLQRAQEVESENLILLAMELYEALGLLEEKQPRLSSKQAEVNPKDGPKDGGDKERSRYVFGARG